MINIEQGALSAFKQHVLASLIGFIKRRRDISDQRLDLLGIGHRLITPGAWRSADRGAPLPMGQALCSGKPR